MKKTDPMYMAMMATMGKAGGIYGSTIVKQQQLALVMSQLTKHTKDHMFMWLSTGELVDATGKKFKDLRQHIGVFVATALRPLMEKLLPFMDSLSNTLFYLYRNDKQIIFLTRSVLTLAAGLGTLLATLGSFKLMVKLLGFAGIGIPGLSWAILGLGAAFIGLTKNADGVLEKFRVLGAIFKGVYELVANLDPETGMSKISESTRDLLEKHGLLGFVKTIARIVAIIKKTAGDIYTVFKFVTDKLNAAFGGIFGIFKDTIANFSDNWTTWWTSDAITPIHKFVRAASTILGTLFAIGGGKFLGKFAGGILSKIPGVGSLFGGGKAKGTKSDPMYVRDADKPLTQISKFGVSTVFDATILAGTKFFKNIIINLVTAFETLKAFGLAETLSMFTKTIYVAVTKFLAIPIALSAIFGALEGIVGTSEEWGKFFSGIVDFGKAVGTVVDNFLLNIPVIGNIYTSLKGVGEGILRIGKFLLIDGPLELMRMIADGWKKIFGWTGLGAGYAGEMMTGWAKKMAPENFTDTNQGTNISANKTYSVIPLANSDLSSDDNIYQAVISLLGKMDKDSSDKIETAMINAMKSVGLDGKKFDAAEVDNLQSMLREALDSSVNLNTIASKIGKEKVEKLTNKRN